MIDRTGEVPGNGHLDDEALARVLDVELSDTELRVWESHLQHCEECRHALERLEEEAARVRGTLRAADVEIPDLRFPSAASVRGGVGVRRVVAAAAVASVLLALAISPTRAWIIQSIVDVRDRIVERIVTEDRPREEGITTAEPAPSTVRVGIPVTGDVLAIQIAARQSGGRVTFHVVTDGAFAEVIGGSSPEIVVADGVRIRNTAESMSSYVISVPTTVTLVTLQVGNERTQRFQVGEVGQSWVFEFSPP